MKRLSFITLTIIAFGLIFYYRELIVEHSSQMVKKVWPEAQYYKDQDQRAAEFEKRADEQ